MPTFLVKMTVPNTPVYRALDPSLGPTRKVEQKFGGCLDEEEARFKAFLAFPGCKIKSAELVKEKK